MNTPQSALDQDELLGLALNALKTGDHATALTHLKQGAELFPDNVRISYLLGAEHAQIGLYDRAEKEMTHAINLDATLVVARFQLGLLQLTQGRLADARATWAALEELPADNALRLFKQGLGALSEDRFAEARALLQQGMEANSFSPDLNNDMRNLMERIPFEAEQPLPSAAEAPALWFNAYRDSDQSH
jgi:Flp pilus assembly protein TadD